MKPPLTYYGGKQQLTKLILSLIPKHDQYIEPYFGGGAVFFAKPVSKLEVINDTNAELINFYRILKLEFTLLQKEIACTIHSREYFQQAKVIFQNPKLFPEIKRAWAVWVLSNQGFASKLNGSWGYDKKMNKSARQLLSKRIAFSQDLIKRMDSVQIECSDALDVIRNLDCETAFFYCDPPYFNSHMGHFSRYTKQDFQKLLDELSKIKGKFLLSSYPSDILDEFTKQQGWYTRKVDKPLALSSHPLVNKRRKTELLTANYPI